MAAYDLTDGVPRLGWLGRAGLTFFGMAFPLLFVPAFRPESVASLNNYVPVVIDPAYYAGLVALALGVLLPVLRLLANFPGRIRKLPPLPLAMTAGGVIYIAALASFGAALALSWGGVPNKAFNEQLFWGGGHVLQFLYCLLMLTGWFKLARASLGEDAFDPDIFRLAVLLVMVFALPAPFFYLVFKPFSAIQIEAFRRLQFVLGFPALMIAVGTLNAILAARRAGHTLPWRTTAFSALLLSWMVFGVGGLMGFLVTGTDTRTPAHYHGVIAGVNLACMGMMLVVCLPRLAAVARTVSTKRLHIMLFGFGQLVACVGLFWAGGYGAPRKVPSGGAVLTDSAAIGMALHGIGAAVAVAGGVVFVVAVLRALSLSSAHGNDTHASKSL
jgi:cytochrome c oxidase subunit 1